MSYLIGYLTILVEGVILLYAYHRSPQGVYCTWRALYQQLIYRKTCLPAAIALNRGFFESTGLKRSARGYRNIKMARKSDKHAREILRGGALKARYIVLTDSSDLLALCDDLGTAFEQAEGHWPTEDEQEAAG